MDGSLYKPCLRLLFLLILIPLVFQVATMADFEVHSIIEADSRFVTDLPLCQVRLQNQRKLGWLILLPRLPETREIFSLEKRHQSMLWEEVSLASRAVHDLFKPFKLNVASLGNVVPQIHVHVIGRFENDPAWPGPVWGRLEADPYEENLLDETIERVRQRLMIG